MLAGLEEGNEFFADGDAFARAGVAALARFAVLDRKGAEAPQFHAVVLCHRVGYFIENRVDDAFDIPLQQVRVFFGEAQDQIGFGHRRSQRKAKRHQKKRAVHPSQTRTPLSSQRFHKPLGEKRF